jgi:hypothetical protein
MKKKNDAQEECGCWCEFPAMGHDRESRGRHLVLCLGPRNWLPQIHLDGRSAQRWQLTAQHAGPSRMGGQSGEVARARDLE